MITVEEWAEIRRLSKVEHLSKRAIARRLGVHRDTVTAALAAAAPPTYQRAPRGSLLDPYKPKIHALLGEDPELSGVRIHELLQAEGYSGQISILRDFLREVRPQYRLPPVYQRMTYPPGAYGQVDWGAMPDAVRWQGQLCAVHAFVMVLCYSRLLYVEFSLGTQMEDFLRCHQNGLRFFGGVPKTCVYDNLSSVVKRRRGTDITLNPTFQHFAGYYCFQVHPCWPQAPHEKGVVERPIAYLKGNFWAGRTFSDFADLQQQGATWLTETANGRVHRMTHRRPVEHVAEERDQLVALPAEPFDTDRVLYRRVSKDCVVRVDTNDYSVPWRTAQRHQRQPLTVRVDGATVQLWEDGHEVARHPRCYGRFQQLLDPDHYEGLSTQRAAVAFAALEQGFLTAYGAVGRAFYTGLERKTERLQAALETLVRLEQRYAHADIVAALEVAVAHATFDVAVIQYLLHTVGAGAPAPTVTPTAVQVAVEERALASYDQLGGGR